MRRHFILNKGDIFPAQKVSTEEICQDLGRFKPCLAVHYAGLSLTHTQLITDGSDCGFCVQTPCSHSESYRRLEKKTAVSVSKIDMVYGLLHSHKCFSTFRTTGWFSSNHPPWRHPNTDYMKVVVVSANSTFSRGTGLETLYADLGCRSFSVPRRIYGFCSSS